MKKVISLASAIAVISTAVMFVSAPDAEAAYANRYSGTYGSYWNDPQVRTYNYQMDDLYYHPHQVRTGIYNYRRDRNKYRESNYRLGSYDPYQDRVVRAQLHPKYRNKSFDLGEYDRWDKYRRLSEPYSGMFPPHSSRYNRASRYRQQNYRASRGLDNRGRQMCQKVNVLQDSPGGWKVTTKTCW